MAQSVVKAEPNPIYTLAHALGRQAHAEPKYLYSAWLNFYRYIHYKYIKRNDAQAKNFVTFFEKYVGEVIDKLNMGYDDAIEAGTLTYFVLKMQRISYMREVEEALKKIFNVCVEHLNEYSIEKSPVQSKCLGFSYILLLVHEGVENKRQVCLNGDAKEIADFCTYAHFSIALNALLISDAKERERIITDVIKWVRRVAQEYYKNLYPYFIALNMLSLGLTAIATGKREEIIIRRLFGRLSTKLTKERTIMSTSKHVWIIIIIALELNNLKKIKYVPENYMVMDKIVLGIIKQKVKEIIPREIKWLLWISLAADILFLVLSLIPQYIPLLLQYIQIIALVCILVAALLYRIIRLIEENVNQFLKELDMLIDEMKDQK